jgi:hypothetical protein
MQQYHVISNQSKMQKLGCKTGGTTADCIDDDYSYMCTIPFVFHFGSMFTRLDDRSPNSNVNSHQFLDLVMGATGRLLRSRALGRRSRRRRGSGARGAGRSASTRADVLAQNVLVGNRDDAALGLLAAGSATGDEVGRAGGSGGG